MKVASDHQVEKYEAVMRKSKEESNIAYRKLNNMYQDVVQPLLAEVRSKTESNKSLKKDVSIAKHDLKLLNACIRVPAMCEFF